LPKDSRAVKEENRRLLEYFSLEIERMKVKRKVVDYLKSFQGYKVLLTLGDRKFRKRNKSLRDK